jgi:2-hydroxy-3-oxopropionate reductase
MTTAAFLGLGRMGLPMSINLARAGITVRAWNRSPKAVPTVDGYTVEPSAAAAIEGADLILTMLPDLHQVRATCEDLLTPGSLLVVMGTVSPVAVTEWAAELAERDVALVDAPVSGGDVGAQTGQLSVMVGATPEDLERVRPALEAMSSTIRHLGPVGSGQLAKACNQIVVAATLTALGEAATLGARGGLDVAALLDVLAGGLAGSRALETKRQLISSHDFRPGGSAAFQHKDLGFALEAGRSAGVALPVTAVVDQLFGSMRWTGHGEDDHSGIMQVIEALSGGRRSAAEPGDQRSAGDQPDDRLATR